jgi:hypothetical protein
MSARSSRVDKRTGAAVHGSQRQIQLYVNKRGRELSQVVIAATASIPQDASIEWVSPLQAEKYWEYSDEAFLGALELGGYRQQLADFLATGRPSLGCSR